MLKNFDEILAKNAYDQKLLLVTFYVKSYLNTPINTVTTGRPLATTSWFSKLAASLSSTPLI